MNQLPDHIYSAIYKIFHENPIFIRRVKGGMVNHAAQITLNNVKYFVKWNMSSPTPSFAAEARGLDIVRATHAFRVPDVIAYADGEGVSDAASYLILEWINRSSKFHHDTLFEKLGHSLANMHRIHGTVFGLDHDNYIGNIKQHNTPTLSWSEFYREQRIKPQIAIAKRLGRLGYKRELLLHKLIDRIDNIFDGCNPIPSLLHGDFWEGNFFATKNHQIAIFDPAIYYGDREVEIAYTEVFNNFPPAFLNAYQDVYPLDQNYAYRRPLLQLYLMLVHLNHFGEEYLGENYGRKVDDICKYYVK